MFPVRPSFVLARRSLEPACLGATWRGAGRAPLQVVGHERQDFDRSQNRMLNAASSVESIPCTLFRETATILPCQYGMIGTSFAASICACLITPSRAGVLVAAYSFLISAVIFGSL